MKTTASELGTLVRHINSMEDYLRECISSALCNAIYDSANSEDDYPGEYSILGIASTYNLMSDDEIFLALITSRM